jgi:heme-degrading monooxygenase HmoA
MIAKTPKPAYYALIFSSIRNKGDHGYSKMADSMLELAHKQEGFLGIESAQSELGITVSYWKNVESIKKWKQHSEHLIAQDKGRKEWYKNYKTRISKIERDYGFDEM